MGCIVCLHSHHDLCWWSHWLPGTVFATDHKRRLQVNFLIWSDSRIFKHHRLAQCLVIFSYEYLLVISSRVLFVKSIKLQPLPSYESFRSYKVATKSYPSYSSFFVCWFQIWQGRQNKEVCLSTCSCDRGSKKEFSAFLHLCIYFDPISVGACSQSKIILKYMLVIALMVFVKLIKVISFVLC